MKLLDDRVGGGLLLVDGLGGSGLPVSSLDGGSRRLLLEPSVEVGHIGEDVGKEEAASEKQGQLSSLRSLGEFHSLEKSPELVEVVLKWRSGDKQAGTRVEDADDLRQHRVDVLDAMRLVDHDVLPRKLLESRLLAQAELVGGDEDVELLRKDGLGDDDGL